MGDAIYRPLIEDMTWSHSRLEAFSDCPYQWFQKYIRKESGSPKFYASYGSFMHELFRKYYSGEATAEEVQIEFLLNYHRNVTGARPQESTVKKYIQQATSCLHNLKPFPLNIISVEEEFKFDINGVPFIGYVDLIAENNNKELYIIDHKSRDLKPRSKRAKPTVNDATIDKILKQLYLYSYAVNEKYGRLPAKLCINCYRTGTVIEEGFDNSVFEKVINSIEQTIEQIKSTEDFEPKIDFFYCKYICEYSDTCDYWQRRVV